MLRRPHVEPYLRERRGALSVEYLADEDGRVVRFLDRVLRLARRLEGRPVRTLAEALRRQEGRVRDARRLAGIAKTVRDLSVVRPPPGADCALEVRQTVFHARGALWPPVPGDRTAPYEQAAEALGMAVADVEHALYADRPEARVLVRAPRITPEELLDRYNLDLARAVLLDAVGVTLTARGGWRRIFRAVKLARLMYTVSRRGRGHTVELTGPAAAYVARPERYGVRLARVVPALVRAPGWRLEARVMRGGRQFRYRLDGRTPFAHRARRPTFDSRWERALARDFADMRGTAERAGWTLERETAPLAAGGELFLPDFVLRHRDGRQALVEIVGFWTPEYLEAKLAKAEAAGLANLILVVYRGLAVGSGDTLEARAPGPVIWFTERPRMGPVLEAAERVASPPVPLSRWERGNA
jgi:hypothetical protein